MFREVVDRFVTSGEAIAAGTPLSILNLDPATVANLGALNIHTIEQLALVPDSGLAALRQGGRSIRDRAASYLDATQGNAPMAKGPGGETTLCARTWTWCGRRWRSWRRRPRRPRPRRRPRAAPPLRTPDMAGFPITRKSGAARPDRPADGAPGAAVTVTGICLKDGAPVDFAWGTDAQTAPATGWVAGTSAPNGNCSAALAYPVAGTWWLWMRRNDFPRVAEASGPVAVA